MNKFLKILILSLFITQFAFTTAYSNNPATINDFIPNSPSVIVKQERFDPNRVDTWVWNTGVFNQDSRINNTPGFMWPKGSGKFAIFTSGLSIGCFVGGQVRQAAGSYKGEYAPGYIDAAGLPQTDSRFKIYKVSAGDNASTNPDYANWGLMVEFGAPYVDVNNNGIYDPNVDIPGIKDAEQTVFLCMTDGFQDSHTQSEGFGGGTLAIGAEVHLTLWGYNTQGLEDLQFVEWVVINESPNNWDKTFFSIVVDPDLGDAADDYIGCDTSGANKDMAFCYNADNQDGNGNGITYGASPPASGMDFFKSPVITTGNQNDSVVYYLPPGSNNKWVKRGVKELGLTSFVYFTNTGSGGATCEQDPSSAIEAYRYQTGVKKDGTPWLYPANLQPTKFCYPGDPETFTGWSERGTNGVPTLAVVKNCNGALTGTPEISPPGDRRFIFNSGDSNFVVRPLLDTQRIVLGQFVARGSNNYNSVTVLKRVDATSQSLFNANFAVNPPPPTPEVSVSIGTQNASIGTANISFSWTNKSESYLIYDSLLQPRADSSYLKFEGYMIYEINRNATSLPDFNDPSSINNSIKLLQIYDIIDTVGVIIDTLPTGVSVNGIPQYGAFPVVPFYTAPLPLGFPNTGIFRDYLVTSTAFPEVNGNRTDLIFGNTYKFAIVAYAYRTNPQTKFDRKVILSPMLTAIKTITIQSPVAGSEFIFKNGDTLNTNRRDLGVMPIIKDQSKLKDATYRIVFNAPDTSYNLIRSENNGATFDTLFRNNKYLKSGLGIPFPDDSSKIIDGILFKVQKILNAGVVRDVSSPRDSTQAKLNGWEYSPEANNYLAGVDSLGAGLGNAARPFQSRSMGLSWPNANTFSSSGTTIPADRLHKIVIEFSDTANGQWAYRYLNNSSLPPADPSFVPFIVRQGGQFFYQDMRKVPFKVYEIIDAGDSTAPSKRQVNCAFLENNDSLFATINGVRVEVGRGLVDGKWDPTTFKTGGLEILYIFASDYDPNPNTFYTSKNLRNNQAQFDINYVWSPKRINPTANFKSGDVFTIYPYTVTRPIMSTGVPLFYEFKTKAPIIGNSDLAKSMGDMDKIRAVPNPFYGFSDIQKNATNRFITFRKLPKECTIRIYTLSGEFIRKLEKNNDESIINWDLKNLESVPIASGMYIALIEAPGIGEKIIKLAVFTSEERIDF